MKKLQLIDMTLRRTGDKGGRELTSVMTKFKEFYIPFFTSFF